MTHLYLIRHGEALSAVQNIIANTGLSPLGIKQAERLRDRLAATGEINADVLIASTMLRARETAEIIAPALDLPIILNDEVQEWRNASNGDISVEAFKARFDPVELEQKPFFHLAPGVESWAQFMLRAGTALNRIIREYAGKTIVIVCHGGIIDCSFIYFLGMSTLQFPKAYFHTHNTSITHWYKGSFDDLPPIWMLECYNDVMHLRDIDSAVRIPWKDLITRPVVGANQTAVPAFAILILTRPVSYHRLPRRYIFHWVTNQGCVPRWYDRHMW